MLPIIVSNVHTLLFYLSSRRSLISQASLLLLLLDFWHFGIVCSCAFKRQLLKSNKYSWTQILSTSSCCAIYFMSPSAGQEGSFELNSIFAPTLCACITSNSARCRRSFRCHGLQSVLIPHTMLWELNGVLVNSNGPINSVCVQVWPVRHSWLLYDVSCRLLPAAALWWEPGQDPAASLHFFSTI